MIHYVVFEPSCDIGGRPVSAFLSAGYPLHSSLRLLSFALFLEVIEARDRAHQRSTDGITAGGNDTKRADKVALFIQARQTTAAHPAGFFVPGILYIVFVMKDEWSPIRAVP